MQDSESYLFLTIFIILACFGIAAFLYKQWKNAPPKWTVGTFVFTLVFLLWSLKDGINNLYWAAVILGFLYLPVAIITIIVGLIQLSKRKKNGLTYGVILLILSLSLLFIGSSATMKIPF